MKLTLKRHAEVIYGPETGLGPAADVPLTERGVRQTRVVARALQDRFGAHTRFLVSPLLRARQTADLLGENMDLPDVTTDDRLTEIGAVPGENVEAAVARAGAALMRFASVYPGESVLAVSHAGFIMGSVLAMFQIPLHAKRARLEPRFLSDRMGVRGGQLGTGAIQRCDSHRLSPPWPGRCGRCLTAGRLSRSRNQYDGTNGTNR